MSITVQLEQGLFGLTNIPQVLVPLGTSTNELINGPWIAQPIRATSDGAIVTQNFGPGLTALTTLDNDDFGSYTPASGDISELMQSIVRGFDADDQDNYRLIAALNPNFVFETDQYVLGTAACVYGIDNTGGFTGPVVADNDYATSDAITQFTSSARRLLATGAFQLAYNDKGSSSTSWDRWRNNTNISVLPSAARTTSQLVSLENFNHRGVAVIIDITLIPGAAPSLTVNINGQAPQSGKKYALLSSIALTVVGVTVLTVYPGLIAVANQDANNILPRFWEVEVLAGNANSVTYQVEANLVL